MTKLIVSLGEGKGSWAHILKLVNGQEWEHIYFISDESYAGKFTTDKPHDYIRVDVKKPLKLLTEDIAKQLTGKINDFEVAINIISGNGKEHMALLSALIKLGFGIRFVAFTGEKVDEV